MLAGNGESTLKERVTTPSPYAMAAVLCHGVMESAGQDLLVEMIRVGASEDLKDLAMVLIHQNVTAYDMDGLANAASTLSGDLMNYVFFGVQYDHTYRTLRDQRHEAPTVRPMNTCEFCVYQAIDSVRTIWMGEHTVPARAEAAYVALLNLALKRVLLVAVTRWGQVAQAEICERNNHAGKSELDYAISSQRTYEQMRTDLYQHGFDALLDREARAAYLDKKGELPNF